MQTSSNNGTRDNLSERVIFRISPETDRAMRLISAQRDIRLSDAYRQATRAYIAGIMSSLESTVPAGAPGQGDAELAAALRAALA